MKKSGKRKELIMVKVKEVFKSLSGVPYPSKAEYLKVKGKRPKSKFSLILALFCNLILVKKVKRIRINLLKAIGVEYVAEELVTNSVKGVRALLFNSKTKKFLDGNLYRIEERKYKTVPKKDKSNGTISGLVEFTLVQN